MIRKNNLLDVAKSGKRDLRESGKLSIKLNANDELITYVVANGINTFIIKHILWIS